MELSQRTGQLLITCLMGRGTPVAVTLPLHGISVKDAMAWRYAVGGWRSGPSTGSGLEVEGRGHRVSRQRSEVRSQRSEDSGQIQSDAGMG
jgi:hypothetical protein